MSIETKITQAWQRKALWLWFLLPVSWLYAVIITLRRKAYDLGLLSSYRATVPVMIVGNITIGGSGKTPLIITLVKHLQSKAVKVGIISRGYGGDNSQMPALVNRDSLPSVVGDEPCLIVNSTGAAMAVSANREHAISTLLKAHPDLELIIADDGLQHYALQRDIEWIVVDAARGFGNRQLLPTGFLREPLSRLNDASVIFHQESTERCRDQDTQCYEPLDKRLIMQLKPDDLRLLWQSPLTDAQSTNLKPTKGSRVHAISGIGYPQRFFNTLMTLGYDVIAHPYPDHYSFSLAELLQYTEHPIIVTTKDEVKIRALFTAAHSAQIIEGSYKDLVSRLWVLPVEAVLSDSCYDELHQQLHDLDIKFNRS